MCKVPCLESYTIATDKGQSRLQWGEAGTITLIFKEKIFQMKGYRVLEQSCQLNHHFCRPLRAGWAYVCHKEQLWCSSGSEENNLSALSFFWCILVMRFITKDSRDSV